MRWEYKLVVKDRRLCAMTTQELNNLGYQGWELVNKTKNDHTSEFIFKRPMKCENCRFHKVEVDYDSFFGYDYESEICSQHDIPRKRDGCEKFKSKDD